MIKQKLTLLLNLSLFLLGAMMACIGNAAITVASFNVSMEATNYVEQNQATENTLKEMLKKVDQPQIKNIAESIQRIRPDILILNEFDYIPDLGEGLEAFNSRFLSQSQNGQPPISYSYLYIAPSNTGLLSPLDINGDGKIALPQDAYGYGLFPGHYGMAILSRYPIDTESVKTFQTFLWADMPNALRPKNEDGSWYYDEKVWKELRLSSKSHWDVPVLINNKTVHLLVSHPTPPVFDGPEDRNGHRNFDEIRFWKDYINGESYIYDDRGAQAGLAPNDTFIVFGDQNASNCGGDGYPGAIQQLLDHPRVYDPLPKSAGAKERWPDNPCQHQSTHTMGLRLDYVLPSKGGFEFVDAGVFWPSEKEGEASHLFSDRKLGSDHRMVWVTLRLK